MTDTERRAYYQGKSDYYATKQAPTDPIMAGHYLRGWRDAKGEAALDADTEWDKEF